MPAQTWQAPQLDPALKLLPPILPYREGMPVPQGYVVEDRPATGLIAGGIVTFAVAYLAGIVIAAGQDFDNGTGWMAAPIVGPWGAIGARTFKCSVPLEQSRKCVNQAFNEVNTLVFMTADGLIQATGGTLFVVGLASGHQELVRQDLQEPKDSKKVSIGPRRVGDDGFGLGVQGVF